MIGWLRPVLRGIVTELVDEYCGNKYRQLELEQRRQLLELDAARLEIVKLKSELSALLPRG